MSIDISVIWFVIIVFATLMYIVMDGFDLGIGMLFSVVHDGEERDVMVNSVAPVWDGNETWLDGGAAASHREICGGIMFGQTLIPSPLKPRKIRPSVRING
ncbi:cytochrome d ubiquinol oxidase subunit II, partial [Klebsiella pneumoniae]|uniref:cytochrome d ubiquinol oxidase subunit II n=2 Tax=Klebsiella pneumoniae TaxID=573 RepID=UPI001D0D8661